MLETNPVLMASSLLFLLPMCAALRGDSMYAAIATANLTVTSVIYHWSKDPYYFWIDQIAIFLYVVAVVYEAFFRKQMFHQILVGALTVYIMCIHHYGYLQTCYIWDADCTLATQHHVGMHFIGSMGGMLTFLLDESYVKNGLLFSHE